MNKKIFKGISIYFVVVGILATLMMLIFTILLACGVATNLDAIKNITAIHKIEGIFSIVLFTAASIIYIIAGVFGIKGYKSLVYTRYCFGIGVTLIILEIFQSIFSYIGEISTLTVGSIAGTLLAITLPILYCIGAKTIVKEEGIK